MVYMVTFAINIPQMLAYIPYMDPMGLISYFTAPPRPLGKGPGPLRWEHLGKTRWRNSENHWTGEIELSRRKLMKTRAS